MSKLTSVYTQIILVGVALWTWTTGIPTAKQFLLAAGNLQTNIETHGYYFAGDANQTCSVITSPDPAKITRCEDGAFLSSKKVLVACDPGRTVRPFPATYFFFLS